LGGDASPSRRRGRTLPWKEIAMTGRDAPIDRRMLLGGIALAMLGLLLALARLELVSFELLAAWWPLALAGFGAYRALTREGEERRGGVWLILVASWLLLNTLRIGGFWWTDSWPLMPILIGLFQIAWPERGEHRFGGFVMVGIGLWLLLATRNVWGLELATSWPLVLVFGGTAIALRALLQAWYGATRRSAS
jgi:hypothetical protein